MPNLKRLGYKIGVQFINSPLVVEQNNDSDNWPRNQLNKFVITNCLFGGTNIVKNSSKSKYVYGDYGIAFGGVVSWSLVVTLPGML